jgi:hypothetical protein
MTLWIGSHGVLGVGGFRPPSILPLGANDFVQTSEVLDSAGKGRAAARERKEKKWGIVVGISPH